MDPARAERAVWARVAYLCRYGHQPVELALELPTRAALLLQAALSDIVGQENGEKPAPR